MEVCYIEVLLYKEDANKQQRKIKDGKKEKEKMNSIAGLEIIFG